MNAFSTLRALGSMKAPEPVRPPADVVPLDTVGVALTHHLQERDLFRYGAGLTFRREPGRLVVRLFLPEYWQRGDWKGSREDGAAEAAKVRRGLVEALELEGYVVRFSDALWCDQGSPGWSVTARASPRLPMH